MNLYKWQNDDKIKKENAIKDVDNVFAPTVACVGPGKTITAFEAILSYIEGALSKYYFFIPQIDWEHIDENQKELWDKGLYDEAVLNEMGLKWDETKTKIIEK